MEKLSEGAKWTRSRIKAGSSRIWPMLNSESGGLLAGYGPTPGRGGTVVKGGELMIRPRPTSATPCTERCPHLKSLLVDQHTTDEGHVQTYPRSFLQMGPPFCNFFFFPLGSFRLPDKDEEGILRVCPFTFLDFCR